MMINQVCGGGGGRRERGLLGGDPEGSRPPPSEPKSSVVEHDHAEADAHRAVVVTAFLALLVDEAELAPGWIEQGILDGGVGAAGFGDGAVRNDGLEDVVLAAPQVRSAHEVDGAALPGCVEPALDEHHGTLCMLAPAVGLTHDGFDGHLAEINDVVLGLDGRRNVGFDNGQQTTSCVHTPGWVMAISCALLLLLSRIASWWASDSGRG